MEDQDNAADGNKNRDEIYANAVRAGKRTYFFDVRATRKNDYYLTITESKKNFNDDGTVSYQKHKLFLYKEDFEKFSEALNDSFKKIIELNRNSLEDRLDNQFSDVSFEELGKEPTSPDTSSK
ncbi:MAG: hypothetical protein Salg2KO_22410 [Salibacteraceae bacterium]